MRPPTVPTGIIVRAARKVFGILEPAKPRKVPSYLEKIGGKLLHMVPYLIAAYMHSCKVSQKTETLRNFSS